MHRLRLSSVEDDSSSSVDGNWERLTLERNEFTKKEKEQESVRKVKIFLIKRRERERRKLNSASAVKREHTTTFSS